MCLKITVLIILLIHFEINYKLLIYKLKLVLNYFTKNEYTRHIIVTQIWSIGTLQLLCNI